MGGLNSDFFNQFQYWLTTCINYMDTVVIFNAYGFVVTLWDLYTVSTTLVAFFDAVVFPCLPVGLLYDDESEGLMDDIDRENYDKETGL